MIRSYGPNPVILLLAACWIVWAFGIQTVGLRLQTEVSGQIVDRRFIPSIGAPRYSTEYTVRSANGSSSIYIAGPTDGYLPRNIPVGVEIRKQRWHLSYEMDGQLIDDFPMYFYAGILSVAVALLCWSFLLWRSSRINREQATT